MKILTLENKLKKINDTFNVEDLLNINACSIDKIASYYKTNKLSYTLFHSKSDFIHMGLSEGNRYSEKDLYRHVETIESYFQ